MNERTAIIEDTIEARMNQILLDPDVAIETELKVSDQQDDLKADLARMAYHYNQDTQNDNDIAEKIYKSICERYLVAAKTVVLDTMENKGHISSKEREGLE